MKRFLFILLWCLILTTGITPVTGQEDELLSGVVDITKDFHSFKNTYFLAEHLVNFSPDRAEGTIAWKRHKYQTSIAFNNMEAGLVETGGNEFPSNEYAIHPELPFRISFVSPRTIRLQMLSSKGKFQNSNSIMLAGVLKEDPSWEYNADENAHRYSSKFGTIVIQEDPFKFEIYDPLGKLLTSTNHQSDNRITLTPVLPFSFVRRSSDYSRSFNAAFTLSPGEKIFGCGESFSALNKRGQRIVLWTKDAKGVQNEYMHKPVPFYLSSRGYGMFVHSSAPMTFDFGTSFSGLNKMMIGDEDLDLFIFLGEPKEILNEYTNLTGKSPLPPLWSFGLWISRISYESEAQGRDVVRKLRKYRIPADVIHFDTKWFETDWRCDYHFSFSRFDDPEMMIKDFLDKGIRTSLWQLPYFVPENELFSEIVNDEIYIKSYKGSVPYEDVVIDFTNPHAIRWYQNKLDSLFDMGIGAIKVDFGEAAPLNGIYFNGRSGFYEHNLYPLRYNKAVSDLTFDKRGERIIWARSAWAGSQRYPVHWGGDAGNSSTAMAATLRGGLSLGLSGFSFWSHDIGGFTRSAPEELYRRWLPFGMLTSHSRIHGQPPTEPWEYNEGFINYFRMTTELRYKLMPYIYTQAYESSKNGLPMLRALFVEFPKDPGSWLVEDQYMFGTDFMIAPVFEAGKTSRDIYLPPGEWIDFQTGEQYSGGWHQISVPAIEAIILVKAGSVIPQIKLAQSTMFMDWSEIDAIVYSKDQKDLVFPLYRPDDNTINRIPVFNKDGAFFVPEETLPGNLKINLINYKGLFR